MIRAEGADVVRHARRTPQRLLIDPALIAARCETLKLSHAAPCLSELVEEASREDVSPLRFLDRVLVQEIDRKDERRVATSLKLSGLPTGKTFDGLGLGLPALGRSHCIGERGRISPGSSGSRAAVPMVLSRGRLLRPLAVPGNPLFDQVPTLYLGKAIRLSRA